MKILAVTNFIGSTQPCWSHAPSDVARSVSSPEPCWGCA